MRVMVSCQPPLLGELVSMAVRDLPGMQLLKKHAADADVLVTAGGAQPVTAGLGGQPAAGVIWLDTGSNQVRRRLNPEGREDSRPGGIKALLDTLREMSPGGQELSAATATARMLSNSPVEPGGNTRGGGE